MKVAGFEEEDFISVRDRLRTLELLGESDVLILPRNFTSAATASDLYHEISGCTVVKLLSVKGIRAQLVQSQQAHLPILQENHVAWVAPAIFITSALISQQPYLVDIALNVLSDYVGKLFRGRTEGTRVVVDFVIGRDSAGDTRFHYDGPASQLSEAGRIFRNGNFKAKRQRRRK